MIFGHFTTRKLAEIGFQHLPKEFQEETAIVLSNLAVNTVEVDGKIIDLTANRSCKEIIASRDKNNYVEGYVQLHISDMIDRDYEAFLHLISEELVGTNLLKDVNYSIVGLKDNNKLVLSVNGNVGDLVLGENDVEAGLTQEVL